jgi:hypothetical protein
MLVSKKKELAAGSFAICAVIVLFATAALAAPNVPSIDQVYQAARSGHLAQAEAMTQEVLHAYPGSARAHYVMAQILTAEGRTQEARAYLEKAERLKPSLPFANPESVAKLERRINGEARLPDVRRPDTSQVRWWWCLQEQLWFSFWYARSGAGQHRAIPVTDKSAQAVQVHQLPSQLQGIAAADC